MLFLPAAAFYDTALTFYAFLVAAVLAVALYALFEFDLRRRARRKDRPEDDTEPPDDTAG